MKLYKFVVWPEVALLGILAIFAIQGTALAAEAGGQEVKVQGNGAVENVGEAKVEEKADITLDYRIAEADVMVSTSIIAATDLRKEGKISDEQWPCVKARFDKAAKAIGEARKQYKEENPGEALFITEAVEQDVSDINTDIQN